MVVITSVRVRMKEITPDAPFLVASSTADPD